MQLFYSLSDQAMEDALYGIEAMRRFSNLIFNMENDQSMELAVLSPEEMQETKGAWAPLVALGVRSGWGGIGGGVSYTVSNIGTDSWSWGGLGGSVASGAIGGAFGPTSLTSATLGASTSAFSNRLGGW